MRLIVYQKTQWDEYLATRLKASIALTRRLIYYLPSKLIILTGTSCSGKSYLSSRLQEKHANIVHLDVDAIICEILQKLIETHIRLEEHEELLFSEVIAALGGNLLFFIYFSDGQDFFYKKLIPESFKEIIYKLQEKVKAIPNFHLKIYRVVTLRLLKIIQQEMLFGKVVILDIVAKFDDLKPFLPFNPSTIILYADVETLSENLMKRNQRAIGTVDPTRFRPWTTVFNQIGDYFQKSILGSKSEPIFFSISQKKLMSLLAPHYEQCAQIGMKPLVSPPSHQFFRSFSEKMVLKFPCNFTVNTSENNAEALIHLERIVAADRGGTVTYMPMSPCLIIMDGMSMSGKTTIARALAAENCNVDILYRSERQRKLLLKKSTLLKELNEKYPYLISDSRNIHYPCYEDFFPHVKKYSVGLMNKVRQLCIEESQDIFKAEEQSVAKKSRKSLDNGRSVILDNHIFKNDLSAFADLKPHVVLVYCPLDRILKHILARTEYAKTRRNSNYWRDPYRIFETFTIFYGPDNVHNNPPVETVGRQMIIQILEQLYQLFPPADYGCEAEKFTALILGKLNLDHQEEVILYPQLSHPDLIVNTQSSPRENAALIASHVSQFLSSGLNQP